MEQTLKEQLAAAHAEFQVIGQQQKKLSDASSRINGEIRRLSALKQSASTANEEAAQVSARRLLGEATDAEAARARAAAESAVAEASGADREIAQLQREAELIHGRYMDAVAPGTSAQAVCNQIRGAILHESANEAAVEYIEAMAKARDALTKVFGHAKALSRIKDVEPFVRYFHAAVEFPAFPTLPAFRPSPHQKLAVAVGVNGDVDGAADALIAALRADGYAF